MRRLRCALLLSLFSLPALVQAQAPAADVYTISGVTDRPDAQYSCGEEATFLVTVKKNGEMVDTGVFDWTLSLDGATRIGAGTAQLGAQPIPITGTLTEPGVLRLTVIYQTPDKPLTVIAAGAAYEPFKIQPTTTEPSDFVQWWEEQKASVRAIPADIQLTKVDANSNADQTTYMFSIANINGTRQYGYFALPTRAGKHPAILTLPGAGWGPSGPSAVSGWAAQGFLAMVLYIHDAPVDLPAQRYNELQAGELADYMHQGTESRDTYYFRRVFLGCTRFMDYLMSRPEWDGTNLLVTGSSQGGGLALACAGLEPRVTGMTANVPALCEHSGAFHGRPAGWPKLIPGRDENVAQMARYFDAVNFARHAKCASVLCTGLIDTTCPPMTVYSAYNTLPEPKHLLCMSLMGHEVSKTFSDLSGAFLRGLGEIPQ